MIGGGKGISGVGEGTTGGGWRGRGRGDGGVGDLGWKGLFGLGEVLEKGHCPQLPNKKE